MNLHASSHLIFFFLRQSNFIPNLPTYVFKTAIKHLVLFADSDGLNQLHRRRPFAVVAQEKQRFPVLDAAAEAESVCGSSSSLSAHHRGGGRRCLRWSFSLVLVCPPLLPLLLLPPGCPQLFYTSLFIQRCHPRCAPHAALRGLGGEGECQS